MRHAVTAIRDIASHSASLSAQLELAAATRTAERVAARRPPTFTRDLADRRLAQRAAWSFRAATEILQAELAR